MHVEANRQFDPQHLWPLVAWSRKPGLRRCPFHQNAPGRDAKSGGDNGRGRAIGESTDILID